MFKREYTYLICYASVRETGLLGTCNVEITRSKPIKTIEDIRSVEKVIKDKFGFSGAVITNYKRIKRLKKGRKL